MGKKAVAKLICPPRTACVADADVDGMVVVLMLRSEDRPQQVTIQSELGALTNRTGFDSFQGANVGVPGPPHGTRRALEKSVIQALEHASKVKRYEE
jgi:hypothetical protein